LLTALLSGVIGYTIATETWVPPDVAFDDFPTGENEKHDIYSKNN
jgi:hypothetical protein